MLIAQITDTHVVAPGTRAYQDQVDTNAMLAKAIDRLNALRPRPDCVIITGDLTDHGTPEEYAELVRQLARLDLPFHLAIGNHDDRATMLASLDYPHLAGVGAFVQYTVEEHPVRLVVLDSTSDLHHMGEFCEERRAWLDARLAEASDRPTIVALHHPPFDTGIAMMDAAGPAWAQGLVETLARYPNVERVLCGHIHRPIQTLVGGRLASVCPSTAHQVTLDLGVETSEGAFFEMEPPSFQLHLWRGGRMVTHGAPIERYPAVFPLSADMRAKIRAMSPEQLMMKKDLVF